MPAVQLFDGLKMSEFTILTKAELNGTEYIPAIRPGDLTNYRIKITDVGGGASGNGSAVASDLPHPFLLLGSTGI